MCEEARRVPYSVVFEECEAGCLESLTVGEDRVMCDKTLVSEVSACA